MLMSRAAPPPPGLTITIAAITIGASRHRKDFGDLAGLADSIRDLGLLQPIGITADRRLVFGERRLRACRDVLGWTEIDVRIVDVPSIVAGEYAENEVRKDFTPSERVAIAAAVRSEIARRQGARTDLGQEIGRSAARVADEAAARAGFGNRETARQASNVIRLGTPKLVEAMDAGAVSITAAAEIAKAAPSEQAAIIALDAPARQEELRRRREEAERARAGAREQEERTGPTAYTGFVLKNGRLPDADEAATIAALDFRETPSADGKRHAPGPAPTKEERARQKLVAGYQDEIYRTRLALQQLAHNTTDPALLMEHVSFVERDVIAAHLKHARAWLARFEKEWNRG